MNILCLRPGIRGEKLPRMPGLAQHAGQLVLLSHKHKRPTVLLPGSQPTSQLWPALSTVPGAVRGSREEWVVELTHGGHRLAGLGQPSRAWEAIRQPVVFLPSMYLSSLSSETWFSPPAFPTAPHGISQAYGFPSFCPSSHPSSHLPNHTPTPRFISPPINASTSQILCQASGRLP